mgnify:CR=1 FL=1
MSFLAEAIFRDGLRYIASGSDPMSLSRGVQKAVDVVVSDLKKLAKPVKADDRKAIIEILRETRTDLPVQWR